MSARPPVDLRSDTRINPTDAIRRAMAEAEVGADPAAVALHRRGACPPLADEETRLVNSDGPGRDGREPVDAPARKSEWAPASAREQVRFLTLREVDDEPLAHALAAPRTVFGTQAS